MPPRPSVFLLAVVVGLVMAGCGGAAPRTGGATLPSPIMSSAGQVVEENVSDFLTAVLRADSKLEVADSLYAEGAAIVANGEMRFVPPRFAGIESGGDVAITSSRLEVRSGVAWGFVEYRWVSAADGRTKEGRASFFLIPKPRGPGWRVAHAHSSTPDR